MTSSHNSHELKAQPFSLILNRIANKLLCMYELIVEFISIIFANKSSINIIIIILKTSFLSFALAFALYLIAVQSQSLASLLLLWNSVGLHALDAFVNFFFGRKF